MRLIMMVNEYHNCYSDVRPENLIMFKVLGNGNGCSLTNSKKKSKK